MSPSGRVGALGMVVPELEQAVAAFAAFGYRERGRGAPVSAGGRTLRRARLGLDGSPELLLAQLDDPGGEPALPRWGLDSHPCWTVAAIEPAVEALHKLGMARENQVLDRFGPEAGEGATYLHFDSPWGMDLELICEPGPLAYEAETELHLWRPAGPAPLAPLPGNLGLAHMGMRVPDLDRASEFFCSLLGCEPVFRHPRLQRSGGRWREVPAEGEPPPPDRSRPDERFPHGTTIEVAYLRAANLNFELMQLSVPDDDGVRRPAFDPEAAKVMHPVFLVESPAATAAALEAAGARPDTTLPGSPRWLTPWGQALALAQTV